MSVTSRGLVAGMALIGLVQVADAREPRVPVEQRVWEANKLARRISGFSSMGGFFGIHSAGPFGTREFRRSMRLLKRYLKAQITARSINDLRLEFKSLPVDLYRQDGASHLNVSRSTFYTQPKGLKDQQAFYDEVVSLANRVRAGEELELTWR
jgi:hypothetical protein